MKIDDFLKKYAEFADLFEIVSEPSYSKSKLLENKGVEGTEEYQYWMDRFLKYGGKLEDL